MIGFLKGTLIQKNEDNLQCVLLCNHVGYELTLHKRLFEQIPVDTELKLWIHTHMKESVFSFYGFSSEEEKQLFRILLGVSGLGPKSALSLLGEHGAERLAQLILAKDATEISSAPGVGKKTAQRIVLELRTKVEKLAWLTQIKENLTDSKSEEPISPSESLKEDLSLALVHLGYQPQQFKHILERCFVETDIEKIGFEAGLKKLLAQLSGRRDLHN